MTTAFIILIILVAVFTQSLVGFGLALVSMPLLSSLVNLSIASPLIALVGTAMEVVMVIYYRKSVNIKVVGLLSIVSLLSTPLGSLALDYIDQDVLLVTLGVIVAGYGLYALFNPKLPELNQRWWVYLFGLAGGFLGGSLNTNGPPIIIYGNCKRWKIGRAHV